MTGFGRDASEERSPEDIEYEIQRTRERMSTNIDELGDRLSPDNLKQQAKEAIAEKAHDVVAGVGDQARETGTRMMDFITQNPLPAAAVGLGAIWLFTLRKGTRSEVSGDRMARFAYTGPERREPNGRASLGRRVADGADAVRQSVSETVSEVGAKAGMITGRLQGRAGELGDAARERTREARGGLERLMKDNPLAIAAGAAVIGLAVGMLIPETEPERRVMGATRDEIGDRVQEAAGRVKNAAVEAGRDLKDTVSEEISARGPEVKETLADAAGTLKDQLKDSAGRVAKETKRAIRNASSSGDAGAAG